MDERDRSDRPYAELRDLLVITLGVIVLFWFAAVSGLAQDALGMLHHELPGAEDEIVLGLLLGSAGLAALAVRGLRVERRTRLAAAEAVRHQGALVDRLKLAEERFRTLVEQLPVVVYQDAVDEKSTALYVSPQYERVFGYPPEARLDDPDFWIEHLHPDDRERVMAESRRTNETGEPFVVDYRFIASGGRVVWVRDEAVLQRNADGTPLLWQGILMDITERKLSEQALLDSERREREAAERLRALDEMKNTFLAAVSHELRSPLTSILGLALTLEKTPLPDAERTDLLGRLAANARKLDRLLEDLLDTDRLNRGILTPSCRPTDIAALVRRTVENLDSLGERRILIDAETAIVDVDAPKVERIVENLLANAARHAGPNRTIWVRVWMDRVGVMIAVEDDGPGVPPGLRTAIFEPFRQGPTASPHAPGTGIGLSLVAMFAELHGGRAWVEDRAGGGASFRVFLPSMPSASAPDTRPMRRAG